MTIEIVVDENEKITPVKIANELIDVTQMIKGFPKDGLREIVAYLSVYNRYNSEGRK